LPERVAEPAVVIVKVELLGTLLTV